MLALPEIGFEESVKRHNCDVAVAADWVEISLLACEEEIGLPQVSDVLQEQGIYPRTNDGLIGDFCNQFLEMVWGELERRNSLLGDASFFCITPTRIQRTRSWEEVVATSFCLLLSCAPYFPSLRKANKGRYVEQGDLFEEVCELSLNNNGWNATRTGWSSRAGAKKLEATVTAASRALNEPHINPAEVQLDRHKNESGCDLVCYQPYPDQWTGRPVLLVQCASGDNFESKLATPSIDRWRKYIAFSTIPLRGFCTPRAFERNEFRSHCGTVDGLLLDRFRLLQPFARRGLVIPPKLEKRLKAWIRPRMAVLPKLR
ncbi:MAG: hypothetical protein JNN17_14910 [Verrucomicrobiaceae bacterium]|nr:hypothetical protein [Verrucomicrobiaceae bacterium]